MSGPIGLSKSETGTRGLWLEKREAFISELWRRGHTVAIVNKLTKPTQNELITPAPDLARVFESDLLFVEFGGGNKIFFEEDLKATVEIVENFKGPIVFLNDDPDLPMVWDMISQQSQKKFVCWHNSIRPELFGRGLKVKIPVKDFPFSALLPTRPPRNVDSFDLVYIGRPDGRGAVVRELIAAGIDWKIYGRQKEWCDFGVRVSDPPPQAQRPDFYAGQMASLVLADKKHKKMGWRTGRAYHALAAGCPAIVENDHDALREFLRFNGAPSLKPIIEALKNPSFRQEITLQQQGLMIERDRPIVEERFAEVGL
jgi:hypothetical protein